jgi:hypothetical protein
VEELCNGNFVILVGSSVDLHRREDGGEECVGELCDGAEGEREIRGI